ncbi:MAG TPA: type 1 glutamine amidotransferase [Dictyobacter sp.]|jgi:GMP synthase-like glutamine amidotransferase|nr:type 1 glutamine amidotransferase [Dictyobacter sp.]
MSRLLALQNMWDNPPGFVGELLNAYNIEYDVIHVENTMIPDPDAYAAVLAFGGIQHVYDGEEKYPYFAREKEVIRQAVEQDIPFLGICLGGQLLADVMGGQVKQHTMTELGFFNVQITDEGQNDPLFMDLPGYQTVFHWHEDTFDLPAGATLLATSENTRNQAFRYGKRAYGLQYHIELNENTLDTWFYQPEQQQSMIETLGQEGYQALEQIRIQQFPRYQEHTRQMVKNFLGISGLIPTAIK